MVAYHRVADAAAQVGEVASEFDITEIRTGQLPLHGRDRHDPLVGVAQVVAALVRAHLAHPLHQHAGDDLQAVGCPVLDLLHQDRLVADEVILLPFAGTRVSDILNGQKQSDAVPVAVVQTLGIQDQTPPTARGLEIHLVGSDRGLTVRGCLQQRPELRHLPFARAQIGQSSTRNIFRSDIESFQEALAGGQDTQFAVQQ